jgi:tetratricopeptide (TPR) repeat protein
MLYRQKTYIILFLGISIIIGCSTEKNTVLTRTVHNISAKYNGYFNANEIIKETKASFLYERVEDYNQILPLYPLPSEEESKNWYAPMDTAIRKCELVIVENRMPNEKKGRNRNKEWCKWIDDNWMTIGIAQFYKKDFPEALNTFEYVINHYPIEESFYESQFWKAKVLIEMEAYDEAEELLLSLIDLFDEQESIEEDEEEKTTFSDRLRLATSYNERKEYLESNGIEISEKLISLIYPVLADLYLKSNQIDNAKASLNLAIQINQKKAFKARMIFILAQLYHQEGNFKASQLYNEVIEMNPDYEMAFQAKINRALSFSDGDTKAIKQQLIKMLKDDKNIDFFDQIYYALAEIAFKEKKEQLGIEYLHMSINTSKSNPAQKVKSLIGLADWYYLSKKYNPAYLYFDTASKTITTKDRNYLYVTQNLKVLKNWDEANSTVTTNDSILNMCNMSESELTDVMLEYIDKLEKAKEIKEANQASNSPFGLINMPRTNAASSTLFLWDENLKGIGYNDFLSVWGERKLEDNWRRSIKSSFNNQMDEVDSVNNPSEEMNVDYLISKLPCEDPVKIDSLKKQTLNALFDIGILHHYQIINLDESKKKFNRIVDQFQPADKSIASLYELYLIYETEGNNKLKQQTKDLLIKNYPKSNYAQLLIDPSSVKDQEKIILREQKEYVKLFDEFQKREYSYVINMTEQKLQDTLNPLYCKYAILNAYAIGKTNNNEDSLEVLIQVLKNVSTDCKGSTSGMHADEILMQLLFSKSENQKMTGKSNFTFSPNKPHFFLLYAPKGSIDLVKSKNTIANFNKTSFSKDNLKTSNTFLNTSDQMIFVKSFKNLTEAMDYFTAFRVNKGPVSNLKQQKYFIITADNLTELYREKKVDNYEIFFNDYYILD